MITGLRKSFTGLEIKSSLLAKLEYIEKIEKAFIEKYGNDKNFHKPYSGYEKNKLEDLLNILSENEIYSLNLDEIKLVGL